jgi:hypothetical protein
MINNILSKHYHAIIYDSDIGIISIDNNNVLLIILSGFPGISLLCLFIRG